MIGHRGLGARHSPEPENSVIALVTALKSGVSAVEFDVQLTSDDELVLAHDVILDRMTNGRGCVAEKTLAELQMLKLRDGEGRVQPDTVETFHEALQAIRSYDDPKRAFLADIHIKVYDGLKGDWGGLFNHFCARTRYATLVRKILAEARAQNLIDRLLFTSFDRRALRLVRQLEPRARVGLISDFRTTSAVKRAIAAGYDAAIVEFEHIKSGEIPLARKHHVAVYAWSPVRESDIQGLFASYHVDGVIADSVPNALQACEKSWYTPAHDETSL